VTTPTRLLDTCDDLMRLTATFCTAPARSSRAHHHEEVIRAYSALGAIPLSDQEQGTPWGGKVPAPDVMNAPPCPRDTWASYQHGGNARCTSPLSLKNLPMPSRAAARMVAQSSLSSS